MALNVNAMVGTIFMGHYIFSLVCCAFFCSLVRLFEVINK